MWTYLNQKTVLAGGFKTLASLCFFLPALWIIIAGQRDMFSVFLTIGFGLSLAGDVLLIKTSDKRLFLSGLLVFLLAHLAYSWAFIDAGIKRYDLMITAVVVMAAMIGCYVWLFRHLKGLMKTAVPAYLAAIGMMLIIAIITRHPAQPLIVTGAVLFALSDLFVARQRFVSPGFNNRLIGLPLYYAGQLFLLSALLSA
ncbi:MAG: lysoplasmalogenase [Marinicella pacifica]